MLFEVYVFVVERKLEITRHNENNYFVCYYNFILNMR